MSRLGVHRFARGGGIVTCLHCRRLREELDEAREEARQLRALAFGDHLTPALQVRFGLTEGEAKCVAMMVMHPIARKEAVLDALYFDDPNGGSAAKIVDVFVCKARKKLTPHGIEIETVWGHGWKLADAARDELKGLGAVGRGVSDASRTAATKDCA